MANKHIPDLKPTIFRIFKKQSERLARYAKKLKISQSAYIRQILEENLPVK